MKGIIGYTGFVGGNLISQTKFDDFYNSTSIDEIKGKEFDILVCAGAPAAKWLANKEPEKDLNSINKLIECLKEVKAKKFILISTVDVYPNPNLLDEDAKIDFEKNHAYGKHRFLLEKFVSEHFDSIIIRLPALFGTGLKKNAIFDLLNNNQIEKIDSQGTFQFYNLDNLWKDIELVIHSNIKLLNIATEPVSIHEIAKHAFDLNFDNKLSSTPAKYDFYTKHSDLWNTTGNYAYSKKQVLEDIKKFVERYRSHNLKLAISNIGWSQDEDNEIKQVLLSENIKGLEISPGRFFNSNFEFDNQKIDEQVKFWQSFKFVSMQGLLFKKDELKLFDENNDQLLSYLKKIIDVSSKLGVKVIVFGSPKNRTTNGDKDADKIAVNFFRELARYSYPKDVIVLIEPNPIDYKTDFVNNTSEALALAKKVSHPGFGINMDSGALIMNKETKDAIIECSVYTKHYHISQPMIESVANMDVDVHKEFAKALRSIKYSGWISIEMKKCFADANENKDNIKKSIELAKKAYF